MAVQRFLDLARVDVLTPSDDHVLDAARDPITPVGIQHRDVAGVQPTVGVDRFVGGLLHPVVAEHHVVAAHTELALLTLRHLSTIAVHQLDRDPGEGPAHGLHPPLDRVIQAGERHAGRGLREPVGDRDLANAHVIDHPVHHFDRAWAPGHDPRAQGGEIAVLERLILQLRDEHRRNAVDHGGALLLDAVQGLGRTVVFARNDHRGP